MLRDYIEQKPLKLGCSMLLFILSSEIVGVHRFYYNLGYNSKGFFVKVLDENKLTH